MVISCSKVRNSVCMTYKGAKIKVKGVSLSKSQQNSDFLPKRKIELLPRPHQLSSWLSRLPGKKLHLCNLLLFAVAWCVVGKSCFYCCFADFAAEILQPFLCPIFFQLLCSTSVSRLVDVSCRNKSVQKVLHLEPTWTQTETQFYLVGKSGVT